jgi:hypothetical protein
VDVERVKELRDSGLGASAIAKELGIGRASVYRAEGRKSSVDHLHTSVIGYALVRMCIRCICGCEIVQQVGKN